MDAVLITRDTFGQNVLSAGMVAVAKEDRLTIVTALHDMIRATWNMQPRLSAHPYPPGA